MKQTAETILKMKTIAVKLHEATEGVSDEATQRLLRHYITALQSQLDNLTTYILEER